MCSVKYMVFVSATDGGNLLFTVDHARISRKNDFFCSFLLSVMRKVLCFLSHVHKGDFIVKNFLFHLTPSLFSSTKQNLTLQVFLSPLCKLLRMLDKS